ncbi:MAG TPA: translation elongation factor Ts [Candidatus Paceibacterota bacterium]
MEISTQQIKELRELTGISIMQCRKALEEAGGDREKALVILRKKGGEAVGKKADRTLAAGSVHSYIHSNGNIGAMIELKCETDFVSKNPEFKALAYEIAMHVAATNPEYLKIEDIPADAKATAREVFEKDLAGKPKNMHENILEGKLSSYFNERVLLMQPFIKDADKTIANLLEAGVQKFGEKIEITRFVRFSI